MKRLTLAQTWKECLRMWKWISEQPMPKYDLLDNIENLKEQWLNEHDYILSTMDSDCFFCNYASEHETINDNDCCQNCPGRLVSKSFSCIDYRYRYDEQPKKFYKKLVQLNKKRLERNRRK